MKKLISLIISIIMLAALPTLNIQALNIEEAAAKSWNAMAIKYSTRTKLPIMINSENGERIPKTEGFEFKTDPEGGIEMGVPSYEVFPGSNGASIITGKHKTPLGGLSVDISLDDFDFTNDKHHISNNIGILWTEEPISDVNALENGDYTRFYGLGRLIPTKKDEPGFAQGVPARDADPAELSGKALYINLSSHFNTRNTDPKIATTLNIVYFDGHFINEKDGFYGYSWEFTVNSDIEPYIDDFKPAGSFDSIDLSNGLVLTVKEDIELGYIVNINGKDYYRGGDVAYFPSADTNGYALSDITELDIDNNGSAPVSMKDAGKDIDLSGLRDCGDGYLTIGVTSIDDMDMIHGANITVNKINTIPASEYCGESGCKHPETEWITVKEVNCGNDGIYENICTLCGARLDKKTISATNDHIYPENWTVEKDSTCVELGIKVKECSVCGDEIAEKINYKQHSEAWRTIAPTCIEQGVNECYCEICNTVFTDKNIILEKTDHIPGGWHITKEPSTDKEGEQTKYCINCNTVLEKKSIPMLEKPPFNDISHNAWYYEAAAYCTNKGYLKGVDKDRFDPDSNLTREQFVTILARVDGADLTHYTESNFTDVNTASWYSSSVIWAESKGYVQGIGNGKFGIGVDMTREQLATLFCRYAKAKNTDVSYEADLSEYTDASDISSWAYDSCVWAVEAKLINSTSGKDKIFSPQMTVTRAQAAQIFMNYDKNILNG